MGRDSTYSRVASIRPKSTNHIELHIMSLPARPHKPMGQRDKSMARKRTILVALIHNKNQERLDKLRPKLDKFALRFNAKIVEIFEQPELTPVNKLENLFREAVYRKLEARQKIYTNSSGRVSNDRSSFLRYLTEEYKNADKHTADSLRKAAIERILTRKHIAAWASGKTAADFLIVMEDDAVFQTDTIIKFENLMRKIESLDSNSPLYVDLAGGFPFDAIGVTKNIVECDNGLCRIQKLMTNTTCCYLVNRRAAAIFSKKAASPFRYKGINPDWFINSIGHETEAEDVQFLCFHGDPPLWQHGSMTGMFPSLMR